MCVCVCARARHLGPRQVAQSVQQGLEGSVRNVALQLLQLLFGENLHEVVDVQQDPVQVDAVDGAGQEADHPPQALHSRGGGVGGGGGGGGGTRGGGAGQRGGGGGGGGGGGESW